VIGAHDAPIPACAVEGVVKSFGAVRALKGVSLAFLPGEVHAVLGENGAGKSTLMHILVGAHRADEGALYLDGRQASVRSTREAREAGVGSVFQELSLFPDLDVLANLFPLSDLSRLGFVRRRRMARVAGPVLERLGLDVDLRAPVEQLGLHDRQLLEIARVLISEPRVLLLDEPTSALDADATARLFGIVRELRAGGVAVIFISHRLEEVFAIADRISVLRDGELVSTCSTGETDMRTVVTEMIGRSPDAQVVQRVRRRSSEARLELSGVAVGDRVRDVDLLARGGEIVGLAGLEGAGHDVLLEAIFGMHRLSAGTIELPGGETARPGIARAVHAGVAMVPADRRRDGLMLDQDITTNLAHVAFGALGRRPWLKRKALRAAAQRQVDALSIGTADLTVRSGAMSGGNQQKVLLGRWLEASPKLLLLDDPTRGVDVGAKAEIYQIIRSLADEGRIVVLISTEHLEYEYLCDRVLIFHRGEVRQELADGEITEHAVVHAINTGGSRAGEADRPETPAEVR
jgi:ABC-type sugar transport system ATPase subunit